MAEWVKLSNFPEFIVNGKAQDSRYGKALIYNNKIYHVNAYYQELLGNFPNQYYGPPIYRPLVNDISTDTWQEISPFPQPNPNRPISIENPIIYNDNIYCQVRRQEGSQELYIYRYNITSNAWSILERSPSSSVTGLSWCVFNRSIVVFGGWRRHLTGDGTVIDAEFLNIIQVYNLDSQSWISIDTNFPNEHIARQAACIQYGNDILTFGGYGTSDCYKYNLDTNSWQRIITAPVRFEEGSPQLHNNKIYINSYASDSIYVYYPNENTFEFFDNVPTSVTIGLAVHNNFLYISSTGNSYADQRYKTDISGRPTVANPSPISGFLNEKEPNTFSWELSTGETSTPQFSATFEWRNTATPNTINRVNVGTEKFVTIPANTFPDGSFQWRVIATSTSGLQSEYTDWFTITTIDSIPGKPTNLNPSSGARSGAEIISFTWRHNSPQSTPQSAYEIQITYNNGTSYQTLAPKTTTSSQIYNAPANSIKPTNTSGTVGWRVRTYNSDNVASDWADTVWFAVEAAPDPPTWVSVNTGSNFPLCRWTSPVQTSYRLQVTAQNNTNTVYYDSGRIFSRDTEHKLSKSVDDGTYLFRVMVTNSRGVESDWANLVASIITQKKMSVALFGESIASENSAHLWWEVNG